MTYKNQLEQLERKMQGKLSSHTKEADRQRFIGEAVEAVEKYLMASTEEEMSEAIKALEEVDEQRQFELPKDFFKKYSVNELRKLAK